MNHIEKTEIEKMLDMAQEAMGHAYSVYSNFQVGACLKAKSGKYYLGCNIENAAFSPTICAERTAMVKAVFEGERDFEAIAIICSGENPSYPCGVCRQVLSEFCDGEMPVVSANCRREYTVYALSELLPCAFGPKDLNK